MCFAELELISYLARNFFLRPQIKICYEIKVLDHQIHHLFCFYTFIATTLFGRDMATFSYIILDSLLHVKVLYFIVTHNKNPQATFNKIFQCFTNFFQMILFSVAEGKFLSS